MKNLIYIVILAWLSLALSFDLSTSNELAPDKSVSEILNALGDPNPTHYRANIDPQQVEMGRQLVYNGRTKMPDGSMSNYISKFYVCTDCHNQVQEDPILTESDPEKRLQYINEKGLKFLQATTFWGMVNREFWYNDDYVLKYGSLVEAAHKSLEESTQLCARECSSGRYLEAWELEAIIQYYWTLELKIKDLNLSSSEYSSLETALKSGNQNPTLIKMLKSKYALKSPATFVSEPENRGEGFSDLVGNAENGELIWENSCKTCHREYGPSQLLLDNSRFTFNKFKRNFKKDSNFNLYTIIRHGTYAEPGHRQYMPLYPEERMSNQQIEDIRAFIERELQ